MKTRENITLFECDFCKKRLIRKSAMEIHEHRCNSNPDNMRACIGCKFAEKVPIEYYYDAWDGDHIGKSYSFKCTKLNKLMYPYKAERMGLVDNFPEQFEGQEAMPLTCEHHKY